MREPRKDTALKIWRYVDLAKFVSMVATGTLYFPCATTELADPYEGWLPRSHIRALTEKLMRGYLEGMKQTRNAMQPGRHRAAFDAEIKHPQEKFDVRNCSRGVQQVRGELLAYQRGRVCRHVAVVRRRRERDRHRIHESQARRRVAGRRHRCGSGPIYGLRHR